ncbi:unnamed protein product [Macrosiphum euphorbiae]|uniref:Uncharacterized protein n=1 Tax=Macrosiphum euphorbiae TaxID=13131 RepID=A0AAV0XLI3_9HEMI|nr:unnamed protein product [Macrosiphum euphorbiae]
MAGEANLSKGSFGRFSGACRIVSNTQPFQPAAAVSSIVGHAAHNKDATVTTEAYGTSRVRYCVRVCLIPGHNKPNFPGCHLPVPRGPEDRTPSPGAVVSSRNIASSGGKTAAPFVYAVFFRASGLTVRPEVARVYIYIQTRS